jgi:hypothetical protein
MKIRRIYYLIALGTLLIQVISPAVVLGSQPIDREETIAQQVHALVPLSVTMVDGAITALSGGYDVMSPWEREWFLRIYDPSHMDSIDERFVESVLNNFRRIRRGFDGNVSVEFEQDSANCKGMRLFYTDFIKVHVCPYFLTEEDTNRKARTLIHEMAHIQLLVTDRPYFDPKSYSSRYAALTPHGSWAAQLTLIGSLVREINRSDTLYHPDAYAWFAAVVTLPEYR